MVQAKIENEIQRGVATVRVSIRIEGCKPVVLDLINASVVFENEIKQIEPEPHDLDWPWMRVERTSGVSFCISGDRVEEGG